MFRRNLNRSAGIAALLATALLTDPASGSDPESIAFFEKKIRPVLAEKCYRCHSADAEKLKAGLQLDHLEHQLAGGDTGPAIVAGKPDDSLLIETIRYSDPDMQMPPKGKLDDAIIADFEKWIGMGAPWPEEPVPQRTAGGIKVDGSDVVMEAFDLQKRKSEHWSWQAIQRPDLPKVENANWPFRDLDHFILASLESADLAPADLAAPETWLRRVHFDLVGLPPSPEEIAEFLAARNANPASDAPEKAVVDRLLASPHFGERWARHWMDLARFAETCGHEFDYPIPHAWRYRDYLIDAFNDDLPFDQFLTEHLAGDLVENPRKRLDETNASIVATGFWFLHEAVHAPTDIRGDEADRIDNQIDVFSKSFLGLTVACARCHDHKFDAISTADYYAMAGFLQSSRRQEAFLDPHGETAAAEEKAKALQQRGQASLPNAFGSESANDKAGEKFARYLIAAQRILSEIARETPSQPDHVIFADFEEDYGDWKITGKALGNKPATGAMAADQKLSGFRGKGLVNTWSKTDSLTGRALSPEFTIESNFIHFLIAGGNHPEETCINLLIDGEAVETATGENSDQLKPHTWKVETHRGKTAHIEIVDEAAGDWGHIDADHFVFSDDPAFPETDPANRPVDPTLLTRVAREEGSLEESTLLNWVTLLRDEVLDEPNHPLHAWRALTRRQVGPIKFLDQVQKKRDPNAAIRKNAETLASFDAGSAEGWTATGSAFGEVATPIENLSWAAGQGHSLVVTPGTLSTASLPNAFSGVLRSPTFELTHDHILLRIKSKGAQVRLVIDGHYMNHYHQLLLRGTILKTNTTDTEGEFRWLAMQGNLDKYLGHRVWLEITDGGGDAFVELDEVLLSDSPISRDWDPAADAFAHRLLSDVGSDDPESLAHAYGRAWGDGLKHLQGGTLSQPSLPLLDLAWRHNLWPRNPQLVAAEDEARKLTVPAPVFATAMLDGTPEDERVHIRGGHQKLGEPVPRRNLESLGGNLAPADSSGRLELARELVGDSNPLVRRVAVNRLWHQLFGRGIVPTVDDFGVMGQPPSHPELLDWLASDFSEKHGWSLKKMLTEIVLSRTYRMSSTPHPGNDPARLAVVDPENILLHRAPVRRLQAEAVRDAILAVSGRLDPLPLGKSVPVHLTSFMEGRGRPRSSGPLDGDGRRSLYTEIRRNFLPPFLLTFDMPIPFNAIGRRSVSNVPAQALSLMNDPFVIEQASIWAETIQGDSFPSDSARIESLFLRAYGRPPSDTERGQVETFLSSSSDRPQAWADLCHALLNKKEFIYLN